MIAGTLLAMVYGLLCLSVWEARWEPYIGPGVGALFGWKAPRFLAWVIQVVTLSAAGTAWVTWWARARSSRDFDGSYLIWGWATASWLFYAFCLGTGAHWAFSQTVLFFVHWHTPGAGLWCWLMPVFLWGWGIGLRLEYELRACTPARTAFFLSGLFQFLTVAVHSQRFFWPELFSPMVHNVLLWGCLGTAQVTLFTSMSLQARHALYLSAESPRPRRRQTTNTSAVDRPGFWARWWDWLFGVLFSQALEEAASNGGKRKPAGAGRKKPATRRTRRVLSEEESGEETAEDGDDEYSEESEEMNGEGEESEESEEAWMEEATAPNGDGSSKNYRVDDAHEEGEDDDEGDDEQYRGLSKRERRRLQAQQREQERQQQQRRR